MKYIIIIGLITNISLAAAQSVTGVIQAGSTMPSFELNNVRYFKEKQVTLESFKGKWLIIYIWGLGCKGSVYSLSDVDQLQNDFPNEICVLPIGLNNGRLNDGIEKVFDRLRERNDFVIPVAYDSVLAEYLNIPFVPYVLIVNPHGIVHSITNGIDLSPAKVHGLINGMDVSFRPAYPDHNVRSSFDLCKDQAKNNGFLATSVLTKWNGERRTSGVDLDFYDKADQKGEWSVTMKTLSDLYFYAYFGKRFFYPHDTAFYRRVFALPVVEVEDREPFQNDFKTDHGKGVYNYYLKMPKDQFTRQNAMRELQRSLNLVFGYDVVIETREMPVWKLIAGPGAHRKLKSNGGAPERLGRNALAGVTVRNYPMRQFLMLVVSSLPNPGRLPYIDVTDIDFGIDASIQTDMTDLKSVQNALKAYELKLIKGTKSMKVLVIKG